MFTALGSGIFMIGFFTLIFKSVTELDYKFAILGFFSLLMSGICLKLMDMVIKR
jgi:hypothetical protein